MQCKKCNYVMSDFEEKCPRCEASQAVAPPPLPAVSTYQQPQNDKVVFLNDVKEVNITNKFVASSLIALLAMLVIGAGILGLNHNVRHSLRQFITHNSATKIVLAPAQDARAIETTTILPSKAIGIFYDELEHGADLQTTYNMMDDFEIQMQDTANHLKDINQYDKSTAYELTSSAIGYLKEWEEDSLNNINYPASFGGGPNYQEWANRDMDAVNDLTQRADKAGVIVVKFDLLPKEKPDNTKNTPQFPNQDPGQ